MSRSYRRTPITANTAAKSEKKDKWFGNRAFRRASKVAADRWERISIDTILREVTNVYNYAKNGKHYFDLRRPYEWKWRIK